MRGWVETKALKFLGLSAERLSKGGGGASREEGDQSRERALEAPSRQRGKGKPRKEQNNPEEGSQKRARRKVILQLI